jgi:hypothetical protein
MQPLNDNDWELSQVRPELTLEEQELSKHLRVRQSHEKRVRKLLSQSLAQTELLDWKCSSTCQVDCLKFVKELDFRRKSFIDQVMKIRKATCAFSEQKLKEHIKTVLQSLLRINRHRLKLVACGVEVCKQAFIWAYGFSQASFNRVFANINNEYQEANPVATTDEKLQLRQANVITRSDTARRWLCSWLMLMRHNPPNAESPEK